MFGIGFGEMLVIAVVVLIAVGPKKMPTFMKAVGKGIREFRHATRELKNAAGIDELLRDPDLKNPLAHKPKKHKARPNYLLTDEDIRAERPLAGADISHAAAHPEDARALREPKVPLPDGAASAGDPVFDGGHGHGHDAPRPVPAEAPAAKAAPAPKATPPATPAPTSKAEPDVEEALVPAGGDGGGQEK